MARLTGKNVLITGASSGIGKAIAIRFAQEGANVAINYFGHAEGAEATRVEAEKASKAGGNSGKHLTIKGDVSDESQVQQMFSKTLEALGSLDILVNNAGIQKPVPSDQLEVRDFDRIIGVNLRGAFLCSREAIRQFLSHGRGGVIVTIPACMRLSQSLSICRIPSARAAWKISRKHWRLSTLAEAYASIR